MIWSREGREVLAERATRLIIYEMELVVEIICGRCSFLHTSNFSSFWAPY